MLLGQHTNHPLKQLFFLGCLALLTGEEIDEEVFLQFLFRRAVLSFLIVHRSLTISQASAST
jgi:hypothetical protein